MTETTILDEAAVSEIEARDYTFTDRCERKCVILSVKERDALCVAVKHLRERLTSMREAFNVSSTDRERELQSQLEQLRATLAQVEQERDRILQLYNSAWLWVQQRVKHPNSGLPPAAMTLMEMLPLLNQRAIQLCKDKAAEYERQLSGDIGIVTAATLNAQKQTASELAAELEKL